MKKLLVCKWLISIALLLFFLSRIELEQVWEQFRQLNASTLIIVGLLSILAWWFSAVRLWFLAPEFSLLALTRMTFIGLFYSTVMPGQIAGDIVKAYRLRQGSEEIGYIEAVILVDRIFATLTIVLIGTIAAFITIQTPFILRSFFLVSTTVLSVLSLTLASSWFRQLFNCKKKPKSTIGRKVYNFFYHLTQAAYIHFRNFKKAFLNFAFAIFFHIICICIHMMLGNALGVNFDIASWCLVYAGISLFVLLPITIAGIGVREGGYVALLGIWGVNNTVALSLSWIILAYNLLGALIGFIVELSATDKSQRLSKSL